MKEEDNKQPLLLKIIGWLSMIATAAAFAFIAAYVVELVQRPLSESELGSIEFFQGITILVSLLCFIVGAILAIIARTFRATCLSGRTSLLLLLSPILPLLIYVTVIVAGRILWSIAAGTSA